LQKDTFMVKMVLFMDIEKAYERAKKDLVLIKANDPVFFLDNYTDNKDIEIAGFLASQFAYGRIDVFKRFLKVLFERIGKGPYIFLKSGDFSSLSGLYYRFQKEADIIALLKILKGIIEDFGSIGGMVKTFYSKEIVATFNDIRRYLFNNSKDLTFFFPVPSPSNPMKRWNLFLRWMVRKDDIDKGLWDFIDKKALIVPLDTNLFKIGRCMGWTKAKAPSFKVALEITEALKNLCPEDPLKYDFFLCHKIGIALNCKGIKSQNCEGKCPLY
ncbi:MAG TPA: TIGR02757 family protein, partial [Syntrophorhabdaceae bacterium]|nr:TIGR02757 family protein [Syntrophorhabdaceae bacterium]